MKKDHYQQDLPGFKSRGHDDIDPVLSADSVTAGKFYTDEQRDHRLGMMLHLAQFGGVLLCEGQAGVGKTTMLARFRENLGEHFRPLSIDGNADLTAPRLFDLFKQAWLQRNSRDEFVRMQTLRQQLSHMRRHGQMPILIIDDAEQLPDEALLLLARLTAPDDDGQKLVTVVLAAGPGLTARLEAPQFVLLQSHIVYHFDLLPFAAEDSERYIQQQWPAADESTDGTTARLPLFLARLVHRLTGGVPARINQVLSVLRHYGRTVINRFGSGTRDGQRSPLLRRGALLVVVIMAVIFYLTRVNVTPPETMATKQSIPERDKQTAMMSAPTGTDIADAGSSTTHTETLPLPGQTPDQSSGESESDSAPAASGRMTAENRTAAVSALPPSKESVTHTPASAATEPATASATAVATDKTENTPSSQQTLQEAGIADKSEPGSRQLNSTQTGNATVAANDAKPAQRQSYSADERWMLSRSADRYTVQLMAMEKAKVDRFVATNKLEDDVHLFQTTNHLGEPVVAVATGDYETRQAAQAAAARLDRRLGNIKSWVRSFASVQQSINQYQQQPAAGGQQQLIARHEQRLLKAPASRYTLQLMAMDDKATLAYLRKHGILNKVLLFRTRGGESGLLAAVTGEYSSKDEAEKAAQQLTKELPGIRPWPRSMASVQQVIREGTPRQ